MTVQIVSEGADRAAKDARDIASYYVPFAKQGKFHSDPAKYRLFGGQAGPGKSHALLWEGILQATEPHKPVDTLILRRTFKELDKSIISIFRRDVPQELYRGYNASDHIVTWLNGAKTYFGYCQTKNDVYQYQGAEFLFIGIDELTLFNLEEWMFLTTRNRCDKIRVEGAFPCMAATTNPGNIGHKWVKSLFVDHVPAKEMDDQQKRMYKASNYSFIPAALADNPIYANDQDYISTLMGLPKHMRDAFLYGNWNIFAGQYFNNFSPDRHVRSIKIEPWWTCWGSVDFGFEHNSTVHFHASDETGHVHTFAEIVVKAKTGQELGQIICAYFLENFPALKLVAIYGDTYMFARRESAHTIADQVNQELLLHGLPRMSPADKDRIGGWMLWYQLLETDYWTVSPRCTDLIETLPQITSNPEEPGDCLKFDGDDSLDDVRYGLKSYLGTNATAAPFPVRVRRELQDISAKAIEKHQVLTPTDNYWNAFDVMERLKREEAPVGRSLLRGGRRR